MSIRTFLSQATRRLETTRRPAAAAVSQASNLVTIAAVNGSLLLFNRDAFVAYSIAISSALVITNAIDPGINQERLLGAGRGTVSRLKALTFLMTVALISAQSVTGTLDTVLALAAVLYSGSYLLLTTQLTEQLAADDWVGESHRKAAYGLSVAAIALPIGLYISEAATVIILAQAVLMLAISRYGVSRYRAFQPSGPGTPSRSSPVVLRNSLVRGAPLNVISNGLVVAIAFANWSTNDITLARVAIIAALLVVAMTPAGPHHFVRFTEAQRRAIHTLLIAVSLSGMLILAMILLLGVEVGTIVLAVATGIVAGGPLASVNLVLNRTHISSRFSAWVLIAVLVATIVGVVTTETLGLPSLLPFVSITLIAASLWGYFTLTRLRPTRTSA